MALNLYTIGEVYVSTPGGFSGQLMQEATMSVSRKTSSQAVLTVANGYSGESPGAPMIEVEVTSAAPSAKFELDPGPFMGDTGGGFQNGPNGLQVVQFQVYASGKTLTFKGFIIEDNFSHAVNSEAKLHFKARGEFAQWT